VCLSVYTADLHVCAARDSDRHEFENDRTHANIFSTLVEIGCAYRLGVAPVMVSIGVVCERHATAMPRFHWRAVEATLFMCVW
jgi:hypothetical protein